MPDLSVVIITHNEERNIRRCIESVQAVASEIVVVDSLSTDRTAEICRTLGCRVISRPFDGYGTQKQFAVDQAAHDWIFSIDADEVATPPLREEIRRLMKQPVIRDPGYEICFSLVYLGRKLRHGGAGRDHHVRLFNRNAGGFTKVPVHEGIRVSGGVKRLNGEVLHYSYRDLAHHLEKLNHYSSRAAKGYLQQGKRYGKTWAAVKFPVSFLQFYFVKAAFLDGYPGFMWSLLAAFYSTLKIAKSIELREGPR